MPTVPHWNQRTPLNSAIFGVENGRFHCSPLGTAKHPLHCSPLEPLITSSIGVYGIRPKTKALPADEQKRQSRTLRMD